MQVPDVSQRDDKACRLFDHYSRDLAVRRRVRLDARLESTSAIDTTTNEKRNARDAGTSERFTYWFTRPRTALASATQRSSTRKLRCRILSRSVQYLLPRPASPTLSREAAGVSSFWGTVTTGFNDAATWWHDSPISLSKGGAEREHCG